MNGTTLNKLIYNIRGLIKDRHSDDLKFTDRNIAFWIKYLRAKLVRQDTSKSYSISDTIAQEIDVKLSLVDIGSTKGIEVGCSQIRSINKLPRFISSHKKDLLLCVSGISSEDFVIVVTNKANAIKNKDNKYGRKIPVAYLDNGYLYIIGNNFYIEDVTVTGVFEDPEEIFALSNPDYTEDDYMNAEYPIESNMVDMINSIIKSNELNLYFQLNEDKVNDSQNNTL